DLRLVLSVARMKMRRVVLVKIHRDYDTKKAADFGIKSPPVAIWIAPGFGSPSSSQFKHEANPRKLVFAESRKLIFGEPSVTNQARKNKNQLRVSIIILPVDFLSLSR